MNDPASLMRCSEVAVACAVSEKTIRNWVRQGKLLAVKLSGSVRIARSELERFLAGQSRQQGTTP